MDKITREEALKRWESAKKQKKNMVERMREMLYEEYKARNKNAHPLYIFVRAQPN